MHVAVENGASLELVRFTSNSLPKDAFDECSDARENGTPFHWASEDTGLDVLRYLDEEYPDMIQEINQNGYTFVQLTILRGLRPNVVKWAYRRLKRLPTPPWFDKEYRSLFHVVGTETPLEVMQILADMENDCNRVDLDGMLPLHAAL
jgi:hypothetical protein